MAHTATTLLPGDMIFASLENGGRTIAQVSKSDFSSIDDVVRLIYSMSGRFMGLARLNIRNKTQGWTLNMSLATRRAAC